MAVIKAQKKKVIKIVHIKSDRTNENTKYKNTKYKLHKHYEKLMRYYVHNATGKYLLSPN